MEIFLRIIILVGCSYLGYGFGNYFSKRHKFILDLITFTNHLKVEIGFSKNHLGQIITNHTEECGNGFKSVLKGYLKALNSVDYITVERLNEQINTIYLSEQEKNQMLNFFNFLGKSDSYNQLEIIEKSLNIFNNILKTSMEEKRKYGGMSKKLGTLIGAFIVIITL
ncbi:MAG: stage III sporulation protein AB [Clostridia bacterium]|nr:stage III sporulation protein AB [Clostridia bacterium]